MCKCKWSTLTWWCIAIYKLFLFPYHFGGTNGCHLLSFERSWKVINMSKSITYLVNINFLIWRENVATHLQVKSSPLWSQVYYAFCFCNIFSMFDNTHTRHFSTIPNFNTSVYDHVHLCELVTFILSSSKSVELPIATTFSNV